MSEQTLVPAEKYLKTGVHIGTKYKSGDMKKFIFKTRPDGLKVLNIQELDKRIATAAKMLSKVEPEKIAVVSRKLYGQKAVKTFSKVIGCHAFTGRFVPGTFTNPKNEIFVEPELVLITEPESDFQAIKEAAIIRKPVIGLCTTNNRTKNLDFIVPINNKGRQSIALVYYLFAREILLARGIITKPEDFSKTVEDFQFELKEGFKEEKIRTPKRQQNKNTVRKRQRR
ncbi:MAG: 30S ribosomal protein S2 [archaeon]